jgi:hypothetical protein
VSAGLKYGGAFPVKDPIIVNVSEVNIELGRVPMILIWY